MTKRASIAVAGAGLIGKRHIEAIEAARNADLAAIVDPAAPARVLAGQLGLAWYPDLEALFSAARPDGIILATPNQLHVANALECIGAGVPALVEKPLAADLAGAQRLADASETANVPLLVGHHRRHNPLIAAAKQKLSEKALGSIVTVHGMFWLMKPDDYFDVEWRRQAGAGPVLLNLIHDIDLLRHLVGEVVSVQAQASGFVRGYPVEESCAILLKFDNGALGTVSVTDTAVAPWSWELTAAENPAYPVTGQSCYYIGGTHGSLELPNMKLWYHPDKRSWWEPIAACRFPQAQGDPLVRQIEHFVGVLQGREAPLVSAREGLRSMEVIDAIQRSVQSGEIVTLSGNELMAAP
ncbi:Gfo/Idh/MocA family protein [Roseibium sp.]|uniref:Gfo/Idh/MocA family protein n=1 Tax=Roseibium sp. TaxID=1936156 RepID=UPI003D10179B